MRVDEHGSITGTCVGSKETDRYLVRVRVSRSETQGDPPTGASAFEGSWIEATCDCPAATKPPFVQHKTTPGKKPSPAAPKGSCKHSCALLLWRARTLALPGDASPAADDDTDPVATQPAAPAAEPRPRLALRRPLRPRHRRDPRARVGRKDGCRSLSCARRLPRRLPRRSAPRRRRRRAPRRRRRARLGASRGRPVSRGGRTRRKPRDEQLA
jgi:hypothetical protein